MRFGEKYSLIAIILIILLFKGNVALAQDQYFTDETDTRIPQIPAICNSVDAADIDNDGDWDVLGRSWGAIPPYRSYYLFVNDGEGYFSQAAPGQIPNLAFESGAVGFGDIENDGDYDIYVVGTIGQDHLFINDGLGYFTDETEQRLPYMQSENDEFVFADFSGDNFPDLILIESYLTDVNSYLVNNGLGYFDDVTDIYMPTDTTCDMFGAAGDLDNDLDLDLLIGWWTGSPPAHIRGLENQDGYFVPLGENYLDDISTRWLDYADFNGDGDLDVFVTFTTPIGILINYNGSLRDESAIRLPELPGYGGPCMPGLGDFDNDGDIDVYITKSILATDNLLLNNGYGYFEIADDRLPDTEASSRWAEPFDADNDGDLDIYIGCSGDGQQRLLINHSTPDTIPPVLMAQDLPIGGIDSLGEYLCKISAYDNISVAKGALNANLYYRTDGGQFIAEAFVHCGGTIFGYFIPGQPVGTQVEYYIEIKDAMDNFITSPSNAPDSLHNFNVLPGTDIDDEPSLAKHFGMQISPNPSNSGFMVSYQGDEELKINVYDLTGRRIYSESLSSGNSTGKQSWRWPGWSQLASGIYFIELSGVNRKEVKKALLIR
jgi:hypothetical protein